ncbi:trypsin-like [Cloeon dipterum]|uniref:trypsin-like n=1 Tax=Cloeon dipterum TaxID=197152 RepID=UPI0032205257
MFSATTVSLLVVVVLGASHFTDANLLENPEAVNENWLGSQLFPKPSVDGKIVGGSAAQIKDFPYQLSMRFRGRHICGASIISPEYALTAAHCIESSRSASKISLRAGSSALYSGGTRHDVEVALVHPLYTQYKQDYDVAILKVKQPFILNEFSSPIDLPQSGAEVQPGTMALTTGWGVTREGSLSPAFRLQSVAVPIVDRTECATNYIAYGDITPRMLCAGFRQGQKDACQGDSGGPLAAGGVLVGIVSWGAGCARPGLPGVYTNLADLEIRSWIATNTGGL